MKLLGFLLKGVLFIALTFGFLVLFQYGPQNFVADSQSELSYWQTKVKAFSPEN